MGYEIDYDNVIEMDNNHFIAALKRLKDDKEITLEQYAESLRRAKNER